MATPALVVDEEAVFDATLDSLLRCLHHLCRRNRKSCGEKEMQEMQASKPRLAMQMCPFLSPDEHLDEENSPSTHLQNFPGDSLTSISLTGSVSGPRMSTGRGEVHSTFWTRWYARLTQSDAQEQDKNQSNILSDVCCYFLNPKTSEVFLFYRQGRG